MTRKDVTTAFTLIEVLVVVAIIALLMAILLPSLARAKFQSRLVVCRSHLHQLGTAIITYASSQRRIPYGPDVQPIPPFLEGNDGTVATSQIWTGPQEPLMKPMALGLLIHNELASPEIMYCPGDDSNDPVEELAKVTHQKVSPGYCSYLYRQLDETNGTGRIEALGKNSLDRPAVALALDMNSLATFDPLYRRTNHKAEKVNVLYVDGAVLSFNEPREDENRLFAMRDEDYMNPEDPDRTARRDVIFQNADVGY